MRSSRSRATPQRADTAQRILDVAEHLVQTRGFNGFSYADVAAELGVTKASLHYHFPTKAELGRALIGRYHERFAGALADIDGADGAPEKLRRYAQIYARVIRDGRMCLCGMLAAEHATLPLPMRDEVRAFFDTNERWLARVLEQAHREGSVRDDTPAADTARVILAALEGAAMVARSYDDAARFDSAADRLLGDLLAPS